MVFQITLFILFFFVHSLANPNQNSSPFDFIKDLQGYEKGSNAPAIHDLKLYLARVGYLNLPDYHINAKSHDFDEALEAALKRYQDFYHLNVTGKLDEATVSQMLMPRCGRPDINRTNQHDTKSFHTVSHYKFFPGLPKWPPSKTNLTYAFWLNFPNANIPPVVRAFNTWAIASSGRFTFTRTKDVGGADLQIRFVRGAHGDQDFDGPGGVLAHASMPTYGKLHFDADENWSVGPGPPAATTFDLETISLHEIGHLLGLDHSKDKNATMWSYYSGFKTRLSSDDIRGFKVLYGLKNRPDEVSGH